MTKSELIKKIHHNNELNFVEVEKIVNEVPKTVKTTLPSSNKPFVISCMLSYFPGSADYVKN